VAWARLLGRVGGGIYHGRVEAAFFDLDKTIISRSSSLALSRPMYRAGSSRAGSLCGAPTRSSGVIGTRAKIVAGRYTGELEFYAYGESKAEEIRSLAERIGLDLEGSYAYTDSITDLPMLEAVGHPVAVNPDRDLRREAESRGWDIRDFRRPVRLRTRIAETASRPRTRVTAGVLSAVVAAAIVGYLVLRSQLTSRDNRSA